jgi:Lipase (class 3)
LHFKRNSAYAATDHSAKGGFMPYDASIAALLSPERGTTPAVPASLWTKDAHCAELSRLAYVRFEEGGKDALTAALAHLGFRAPYCIDDPATNSQAFCTISANGTPYIAFRGTQADKAEDIFSDMRFWVVRWEGAGLVHRGFLRAYVAIRQEIEDWLSQQQNKACVVTGHSLGAALATLMAAQQEQAELVIFGSPRVGTAALSEMFTGKLVRRYVDCADIASRVPPPIAYQHIGAMTYIDRLGVVQATMPSRASIVADRMWAYLHHLRHYSFREGMVPLRALSDHAPINYVSALLGIREP